MIDPKAIVTYAQYNEDLILRALLHDVEKGFYVDVGANFPVIDSVTKIFYDSGWRGINIEPLKKLYEQLVKARPDDINLQCGAGDRAGRLVLREYKNAPGHSTFDEEQKKEHGDSHAFIEYPVEIKTLNSIFSEHESKKIHFIKIDVEGFEYEVVAGNNWGEYRPEVICIEANHISKDWRPILNENKFKLFISDGLNNYYLAEESWYRTKDFAERLVSLDYHALKYHQYKSWVKDSRDLKKLTKIISDQQKVIDQHNQQIEDLKQSAELSLKNQPFKTRLKRTAQGLTTDWSDYKKRSRRK